MIQKNIFLIYGPTAVGKTDFGLTLAKKINGEIINADVGQFYVPLSIGTAKPDWKKSPIAHHLFDIIDEPKDLTVTHYRALILSLVNDIWQRGKTPIIVGGSGFYSASLFFPPVASNIKLSSQAPKSQELLLWDHLYKIDPKRAMQIHKHDIYRIKRALEIWHTTKTKPTENKPEFKPIGPFTLVFLTYDRDQLYQRINQRVETMMQEGWIEEVRQLQATPWQSFLERKKLIGYPEIFSFLAGPQTTKEYENLVAQISQKTRNYAKRQITFWRMLKKKLEPFVDGHGKIREFNFSLSGPKNCIQELMEEDCL